MTIVRTSNQCEQWRSISVTKQSGEPVVVPILVPCEARWIDATNTVDNATGEVTMLYVCAEHSIDLNPPAPENNSITPLDYPPLYEEPACCSDCRYYFDRTSGYCGCI